MGMIEKEEEENKHESFMTVLSFLFVVVAPSRLPIMLPRWGRANRRKTGGMGERKGCFD